MIKNFVIHSLRNFKKDQFFSILNLLGLSLGIATFLVIFSYISFELSYDNFHSKKDRIFRALTRYGNQDQMETIIVTGSKVGAIANRDIPEVEMATRVNNSGGYSPQSVKVGDKVFQEDKFIYADKNFFEVFDFKLIDGNPKEVLKDDKSAVITEKFAKKYFGDESPIGKILTINGRKDMVVKGIVQDPPANSHMELGIIGSFENGTTYLETWFPMNFITYILAKDPKDASVIGQKIVEAAMREMGDDLRGNGTRIEMVMQPLTDIYLDNTIPMDQGKRGSKSRVAAFLLIGLFILIIACINYVNLSTAQSEKRSKEVGIRKSLGSGKLALIRRFYGETAVITFFSVLLALGIVELTLPAFNDLVGEKIPFNIFSDRIWIMTIFSIWLLVTLLAGSYPALYLSSFKPVDVLRGSFLSAKSGDRFRKILVVTQFAISIFLIIGTVVVYNQVIFAGEKNMGYDTEEILVLPITHKDMRENAKNIMSELNAHSGVVSTARTSEILGTVRAGYWFAAPGMINKSNDCNGFIIDKHGVSTLGFKLLAGQDFSEISEKDSTLYVIVNEEIIKMTGWTPEEAIGQDFTMQGSDAKVRGVVSNFHQSSLRNKIAPIVLFDAPRYKYLYVRFNIAQGPEVMAHLKGLVENMAPDSPFEPFYLNHQLERLYDSEIRVANLLLLFTILSIIIGCLGLFGLTTFLVEKRTKEIGIRKVLGAEANQIVRILSWDFIKLIIISCIVACPVAFIVMNDWLNEFAYHIEIGIGIFAITSCIAIMIAFMTVFFHSYKAAVANPADAIRDE